MDRPTEDLLNRRYGKLTVIRYAGMSPAYRRMWECKCDCGGRSITRGDRLRSGTTKSCGCLSLETTLARITKHGLSGTPEYHAWASMVNRCTNKKDPAYGYYGGRGVTVCERWMVFENFLADMGKRPSSSHSLDRIDNDLLVNSYSKKNCRWTTRGVQQRNTRRTKLNWEKVDEIRRLYGLGGCTHAQLGARFGVNKVTISLIMSGRSWPRKDHP